MAKILVVEDEPQMRKGLKDNLEFEGYEVLMASDGEAGLELVLNQSSDLILLDVMLPNLSGFDICKKARQNGIETPIIMLTAKGEEIDKVLGLEIGADDYITKPFSLRELLARIKSVLRRTGTNHESPDKGICLIGNLKVDLSTYDAFLNDESIRMSHKEIEVLKYLWQHRNKTVSRDDLLNEVWGYDEMITTRTIDNFIVKLRQKIEQDPASPRHILTVHGTGYKLISEI